MMNLMENLLKQKLIIVSHLGHYLRKHERECP